MGDIPVNHKQNKDHILKALCNNRGKPPITSSQIRHLADIDIIPREIESYLLELINVKMVKIVKGKTFRSTLNTGVKSKQVVSGRDSDRYYIVDAGIEYVENGFVKPESQSNLSRLVDNSEKANELLASLLEVSHMSIAEQQRHSELLAQLTDALQNKDDGKARNILKQGLDLGKVIAVPLLVEYLKSLMPRV